MANETVWQWLAMGGYGWYVWPAYAFTGLIFGVTLWHSVRTQRRLQRQLQHQWQAHEP